MLLERFSMLYKKFALVYFDFFLISWTNGCNIEVEFGNKNFSDIICERGVALFQSKIIIHFCFKTSQHSNKNILFFFTAIFEQFHKVNLFSTKSLSISISPI